MPEKEDVSAIDRPLWPAVRQGLLNQCPACGVAPLFQRFLRTGSHCAGCGQSWEHHQADDFPAYIVILLLGHILVPLMIEVNFAFAIPMPVQAVLWPGIALVLAIAMIQPVKGSVIAFQWSRRMNGFAIPKD
ncbi:DUF983 domain-containing protein [Sphingobium phenoxybenzoativorans]|uniref:DUF983 domain-containing protein n=1 Tax=Sphingobium phenoxybenzoativorans TaxID=1592790 RepID=UPI0008729BBD|nr:DUF983 domain-containing protein [Sphingobium phenoxybenzoativorans]